MADRWTAEYFNPVTQGFDFIAPSGSSPLSFFSGGREWPSPDTEPYTPSIRSNAEFIRTTDGGTTKINSEIRFTDSPMTFTWTKFSGSQLRLWFEHAIKNDLGFRIQPHTGMPFSGVWVESQCRAIPGYVDNPPHSSRGTIYDIKATFQPISLISGT